MATPQTKARPAGTKKPRAGFYRGIRLVKPAVPPRLPLDVIQRAVKAAFAEKADEIARIK